MAGATLLTVCASCFSSTFPPDPADTQGPPGDSHVPGGDGVAPGDWVAPGDGEPPGGDGGDPTPPGGDSLSGGDHEGPSEATCGHALWRGGGSRAVVPAPPPLDPADDVPIRYPEGLTHSPINLYVAKRIKQIVAEHPNRDNRVFMKVGDSITASTHFMNCVSDPLPEWAALDGYRNLAGTDLATTIEHYCKQLGSNTPFDRASHAAQASEVATWALTPGPGGLTPIQREATVTNPRVAVVMYGTNDLSIGGSAAPSTHAFKFRIYPMSMLRVVDSLLEEGVVPILMSIPPRTSGVGYERLVGSFNAVVRGLAEARQIPFVDYHLEMASLPRQGLGSDGMHPTSQQEDGGGSCNLTAAGLQYGYNVRNWVTLVALERVRRILVEGDTHLDEAALPREVSGAGSLGDPIEVSHLPFIEVRDLTQATGTQLTDYGLCSVTRVGPEHVYRLVLEGTTSLRAFVSPHPNNTMGIRLSLLQSTAQGLRCLESHDHYIDTTLASGTYFLSVDTESTQGGPGDYVLGVVPCDVGDPACQ